MSKRKIYNCKHCGQPVKPWKAKTLEYRKICKPCKKQTGLANLHLAIKANKKSDYNMRIPEIKKKKPTKARKLYEEQRTSGDLTRWT
jgi:recombinational DNA repair protein (RecF pathway)